MRMSEKAVCCPTCFANLCMDNVSVATLWLELCDLHLQHGIFLIDILDTFELNILENKGFIVSTEKDNYIIVKVLGQQVDEENQIYYCPHGCDE